MKRSSGLALPIALVMGSVILMAVFSLSLISSNELKMVSKITDLTKAEALAYSGLQLVEERLFKKRWYQPEGDEFAVPGAIWKTFHHERIDKGDNQFIDIYLDEFPSTCKLDIYRDGKIYEAGLLDNIRVLAVGTSGSEKAIFYGKYIVSPEPHLNSNSTDGVREQSPPEIIDVKFIPDLRETQKIPPSFKYQVSGVFAVVGQRVVSSVSGGIDVGTANASKVCEVKIPESAPSEYGAKLADGLILAPYTGKIIDVFVQPKDMIEAGTVVARLERDQKPEPMNYSLKRMVRIQRLKSDFARTDLTSLSARKAVYARIKELNNEFVKNYASICSGKSTISDAFKADAGSEFMSVEQVVEKMKTAGIKWHQNDSTDGRNRILKQMLAMFCPPEIIDPDDKNSFREKAEFLLGGNKIDPADMGKIDPDIKSVLAGLEHGITYPEKVPLAYQRYRQSGENLYSVTGQENFVKQMSFFEKYSGESKPPASLTSDVEQFIWKFSHLPDSRLAITVNIPAGGELSNYLMGSWKKLHVHFGTPEESEQDYQDFLAAFKKETEGLIPGVDVQPADYFFVDLQNPNMLRDPNKTWRYFFKGMAPAKLKLDVIEQLLPVAYSYVNEATVIRDNKPQKISLNFRTDNLMKFFAKYFDDNFSRDSAEEDPKGRSMSSSRLGEGPGISKNVMHGGQM